LRQQIEQQKINNMKYTMALDGHRPMNIHTTTNQKQASAMEGSMEGSCNKQDTWGNFNTIILGVLEIE
jgi:hypothetical protein